jgi:hypothetical protein
MSFRLIIKCHIAHHRENLSTNLYKRQIRQEMIWQMKQDTTESMWFNLCIHHVWLIFASNTTFTCDNFLLWCYTKQCCDIWSFLYFSFQSNHNILQSRGPTDFFEKTQRAFVFIFIEQIEFKLWRNCLPVHSSLSFGKFWIFKVAKILNSIILRRYAECFY